MRDLDVLRKVDPLGRSVGLHLNMIAIPPSSSASAVLALIKISDLRGKGYGLASIEMSIDIAESGYSPERKADREQ